MSYADIHYMNWKNMKQHKAHDISLSLYECHIFQLLNPLTE